MAGKRAPDRRARGPHAGRDHEPTEAKNSLSPRCSWGWPMPGEELNTTTTCAAHPHGAGGTFCSGMDLKASAAGHKEPNPYQERWNADPDIHWKALLRHIRLRKPLIAAVEGFAVAGGTEILQATHIGWRARAPCSACGRRSGACSGGRFDRAVAAPDRLHERVGDAADRTRVHGAGVQGDRPDRSRRARRAGVVEGAGAGGDDCANGPLAVEAILRSVQETASLPEDEALAKEFEIGWPVWATNDAKEGPRAFAEKRPPVWTRT